MDFKHIKGLSRNSILEKAFRSNHLTGLKPKVIPLNVEGVPQRINIVVHDFKQCMYSLLMDKNLMKPENLLLSENHDLSFTNHPEKQKVLDDIDTGKCYQMAYEEYIKDETKELLCPIIFFIDKTHTDINGRLCLEPVQFTLGIFNRETRSKASAWRTLGYIPEIPKIHNEKPGDRLQAYHDVLSCIFYSFEYSQHSPIIWEFEMSNHSKIYLALKIPVMFIIGDKE